jgi:hypothetical protein
VIQVLSQDGNFPRGWGVQGVDDGELSGTPGNAIDLSGNVIAAAIGNHRLQKSTPQRRGYWAMGDGKCQVQVTNRASLPVT